MGLSNDEQNLFFELENWKEKYFTVESNDFVQTYDSWLEDMVAKIPDETREPFFNHLDQWLFYIQTAIQQSKNQAERIDQFITEARLQDNDIYSVSDIKRLPIEQLNHFANQQIGKSRILSLIQGGVSGSGNPLLLGVDLPAMIILNLQSIQNIALSYGYDVRQPFEMMIALKVFHCATLPKRFQKTAWDDLLEEVEGTDQPFFYEGNEQMMNVNWLTRPLIQVAKCCLILLLRKKRSEGTSLLTIAIGAGVNYSITKRVTEFAKQFYQYRLLLEKQE